MVRGIGDIVLWNAVVDEVILYFLFISFELNDDLSYLILLEGGAGAAWRT